MNICHIASGDLWAGAEVQVYNLLASLRKDPSLSLSAILLNEGTLAEKLREADVNVCLIEEQTQPFWSILRLAAKELAERPPDILHTHRYKENLLGSRLKRKCKVPCLVQTVHGLHEKFSGMSGLKMKVYRTMDDYVSARHFDRVIAVSEDIRQVLAKNVPSDKLAVVNNSVDVGAIKMTRSAHEVRAELGVPPDHFLIGSAGRMVRVKGYDVLIKAAKIVRKQHPNTCFVLAGEGADRADLEVEAAVQGLADCFFFPGFRRDIHDILGSLDMFVISSHHEGIPVVLLEAMALETPIVTTAVGGIPEVVADSDSARLVPPGDVEALATAMADLISDDVAREKLVSGALTTVREKFSVEVQAQRLTEIYANLGSQK
jgi:glycosyltransferase involved in cell wall biosynthesis